jgi:Fic family protein
MLTLDPSKLADLAIPIGTGWLLGACMEARGKQDLWIKQKPEVLEVLREQAIIQSVESSNRIEGVTVAANRLRPLVIGRVRPRDRSEEELAGYRAALDWIFSRKNRVTVTPEVIRRLHALARCEPNGERSVRFVPVSAKKTPATVEMLCRRYRGAMDQERIPPLLTVATFIFDLLCIHPFRDGNGRVSRLATSLLLRSHGFEVIRYVSLERLIEESKEEYYRVLKLCSQGWHEGKNEIIPWWNYFLSTLRGAYKEFEHQVESVEARPAKSDLVRQTVLAQVEKFTLADMAAQLPAASSQLIKKVLAEMKRNGRVQLFGRGRGARWEVVR